MATEKIIFDTELKTGNSSNSIKSLKSELKDLRNQLGTLEQGSEAFIKAASKAGELKDQIQDISTTINAFNPEAKFTALANVVGVAANGFAAMQGAMALMGNESEDLNKVMAKTQGAIALSTGLNGLLGMKDAFKLLGAQVIQLIPRLQAMGAAMVGAVTGGIAIALVLIIAYWKDLKFLITGTIDEVKLSSEEMLNAVKKGHEEYKKAANERIAIAEREAKLKLKGKELDIELARLDKERKITEAVTSGKLASEKELIEAEYQKAVKDIKDKYAKDEETKRKEKNKRDDDYAKQRALDIQKVEEGNREADRAIQDVIDFNKEEDRKKKEEDDKKALDRSRALAAQQVLVKQEQAAAEKQIDEEALEAKRQLYQTTSNILGTLSDLAGKQTEEGKVLAIAQATIDTYLSASSAYAAAAKIDPIVLAPLAAGAAILAGFARVKAIADVKVPNSSGGGGGGNITAPNIPRIPQTMSGAMLNQNKPLDINNTNPVGKVIVTETDITATQDKVKGIIRKATIK